MSEKEQEFKELAKNNRVPASQTINTPLYYSLETIQSALKIFKNYLFKNSQKNLQLKLDVSLTIANVRGVELVARVFSLRH